MKLYVLRHGEAEYRAPNSALDCDRRLTERGRAQVQAAACYLAAQTERLDQIWVSPYLRTQQTAEIVAEVVAADALQTCTELTPDADVAVLCRRLQAVEAESILLVSHQPLVGTLLSWLCGGEPGRYSMGCASLAALEVDYPAAGLADLLWLEHA